MYTREYQNYKRMTKMTVRFLEKDGTITNSNSKIETATKPTATTTTSASTPTSTAASITARATTPNAIISDAKTLKTTTATTATKPSNENDSLRILQQPLKKETTPTSENKLNNNNNKRVDKNLTTEDLLQNQKTQISIQKPQKPTNGRYVNWSTQHSTLASLPWCCIGDLMAFCDKYEYRTLSRNDPQLHNRIVTEVKTLLGGAAPFDVRKRFPSNIHSPENLWVCIGRCTGVEYHLNRIVSIFRRPLDKLSADKQRIVRHDFHLAINELRLDISARISEVRLYDQHVFEKNFNLEWKDEPEQK